MQPAAKGRPAMISSSSYMKSKSLRLSTSEIHKPSLKAILLCQECQIDEGHHCTLQTAIALHGRESDSVPLTCSGVEALIGYFLWHLRCSVILRLL